GFFRAQELVDPTRAEPRGRRDLSERQPRLMGFDDGPDPLSLGFFEPFRGEAQPGGQPLFALNPLAELVVGFHPSRLSTVPAAVQQTGRLMPGFWSGAPHAPTARGSTSPASPSGSPPRTWP